MDATVSLFGSGIGWITALAIACLFHWLRRVAPKEIAFLGFSAACLWLLTGLIGSLLVLTDAAQRGGVTPENTALPLLGFFGPFLVCGSIAALHKSVFGISVLTAFGLLAAETALTAFLLLLSVPQSLCALLTGVAPESDTVFLSLYAALPLSLIVAELTLPLRRGREARP